MSIYIQVGDGNRIVALSESEEPGYDLYEGELPEDWNDYVMKDGKLEYSENPVAAEYRKQAEEAEARAELIAALPTYQADTDSALCEIYESADKAQADTDAALCEIYELLIGKEES